MGRNFDDYPGFQPFRSWANTQVCTGLQSKLGQYINAQFKKQEHCPFLQIIPVCIFYMQLCILYTRLGQLLFQQVKRTEKGNSMVKIQYKKVQLSFQSISIRKRRKWPFMFDTGCSAAKQDIKFIIIFKGFEYFYGQHDNTWGFSFAFLLHRKHFRL